MATAVLSVATWVAKAQESNPPMFNSLDSLIKANEYYGRGAYDSAITIYEKFHTGDTNYVDVLDNIASALYQLERYEESLKMARKGLKLDASQVPSFMNIVANSYSALDSSDKALEIYTQSIEKYPTDAESYYNRGDEYRKQEKHKLALKDFKRAVELNPKQYSAHLALAQYAINQERVAEAMLSLGYCVLANPLSEDLLSRIVGFDRAVSGDAELEPIDIDIDEAHDFRTTNQLANSGVALRESYEVNSELTFPLMRHMQLTYNQVAKNKGKGDGFWATYYGPFFTRLMDEGSFEEFTYLSVLASSKEYHRKLIKSNENQIKKFYEWANAQLSEIHNEHHKGYDQDAPLVNYYYYKDAKTLRGIGKENKKGNLEGYFTFYHYNGAKASEGNYNKKGERTGKWTFYHENGEVSRISNYKNDEPTGPTKEFHDNGALFFESQYEGGELAGKASIYSRHGKLERVITLKDGKPSDTSFYYYPNGQLSAVLPLEDSRITGEARYYHEDGNQSAIVNFEEGDRHGDADYYFSSGALSVKTRYQEGSYHGNYKSLWQDGKLESKGRYSEGVKTGQWQSFNALGTLITEENFDEKGKKNGISIVFDNKGRKRREFEYKRSEIKSYKLYNTEGEVVSEGTKKFGKFYFEYTNLYDQVISEGHYHGDHKEDQWKYYSDYGLPTVVENYNKDGNLEGEYLDYHLNGKLSARYNYKDGERDGYYVTYHKNGEKASEGWYVEGREESFYNSYYSNGKPSVSAYYLNDELNGERKNYNPDGSLYKIETFDEGVLTDMAFYYEDSLYRRVTLTDSTPMIRYFPNGKLAYKINKAGAMYDGEARWYYGNGQVRTEGQYENGYKTGVWKWYYPNGQLETEGEYVLSDPIDGWKYYHPNGQLDEVKHRVNEKLNGSYEERRANGNISETGSYLLGETDGSRSFYLMDNTLNHIRIYDQGRMVGYVSNLGDEDKTKVIKNGTANVQSYYANGQLARKYQLKQGLFTGEYLAYYQDGTLALEARYRDDEREGSYITYYPNGKKQKEYNYQYGALEGTTTSYYKNGNKKREEPYVQDELHGVVINYNEDGSVKNKLLYQGDELYQEL